MRIGEHSNPHGRAAQTSSHSQQNNKILKQAKLATQAKPTKSTVAAPPPASAEAITDSVELSGGVKQEQPAKRQPIEDMAGQLEMFQQQLEAAKAQGKGMAEAIETKIKCMRIAMSIMNGDKVPREDYQFLAENDPELFGKALSMRREREDPKEVDRVSEDKEEEGADSGGKVRSSGAISGESAPAKAADGGGEASGGGEAGGGGEASSGTS